MTKQLLVLHKGSNRKNFDCGNQKLNHYIQKQANQDIRKKIAVCFVLEDLDINQVLGYFTLSNLGIDRNLLPEKLNKMLPSSYRTLPCTLLGRLAVDINYQGMDIGEFLLIQALERCYEASKSIASYAVFVDPIDESAIAFYSKYGFIKLPDSGKMFLPMKTIKALYSNSL